MKQLIIVPLVFLVVTCSYPVKNESEKLNQISPVSYVDAVAETNRYIAWPGQALSYKVGEQKMWEIRRRAESTLAERFDIKAFHDKVLMNGALPLEIFEEEMGKWMNDFR
jgi:uncharacterized protein (DUF885 family)